MELYGSLVANEGSGGGGGGTVDVPIKSISVNGSGVVPVNKNVNIDVPTKTSQLQNDSNFASTNDIPTKTSQLENDSNFASAADIPTKTSQLNNDSSFVTESDLTAKNYADKTYVGNQIAQSEHLKREIVTVLPEPSVADEHTIYMVKDDSVQGNDKYKEYMLIEGVVQCVGDTSVDLTDYVKTAELPTELPANGGNSDTVNNHTVESNVPVDAKFTDTVYDDTEVKGSIAELSSNLDTLEFGEVAGGKNLFKYNEVSGTISKTVECSLDAGTYTISALVNSSDTDSSTSLIDFYYEDGNNESYLLGRESRTSYTITLTKHVIALIFYASKDYANSANDTFTYSDIQIEKGTTATDYEPYIPSVKMLAEEVGKQNESLSVIGKCKNLLNPTLATTTQNGVTCTRNVDANGKPDGTYTLNGTATQNTDFTFLDNLEKYQHLKNRTVKLVGCPKGGSDTTYQLMLQLQKAPWPSAIDIGKGSSVTVDNNDNWACWIRIYKDATVSNLTFKPMLVFDDKTPNATYDDFVPYTGDGDTLTHDVAELKNDLAPKKIELQNVDERVTIQDNGSFIINGFAFVNLLVTFKETLQQWSNFVRLPRPKDGNVTVNCENSVKLTIYSQDNLPGDCGTFDIVQSGTEIRLLVNYEVA